MIKTSLKTHWEDVYSTRDETSMSWYQAEPRLSLELIQALAPTRGARIIDVGGGASVLVDRLLDLPFAGITVLDIAETSLARARSRLGSRAERVEWIAADVTEIEDVGIFDVWHDRAVFHFLTEESDRRRYVELARRALPAGGLLVIACFAGDGPRRCSDLDVRRYGAESLGAELGAEFALVRQARETHATPWNTSQAFFYGVFQRQ